MNEKIRALIIDDEQHCIETLRYDLEQCCSDLVKVVGEANDVIAAARLLQQQEVDLIFLDMELSGASGLDFLDMIDRSKLRIIFTTAHSEYAVKAYKYKAEAYLLKPIDREELKAAVEELHRSFIKGQPSEVFKQTLQLPDFEGTEFVLHQDILYLQADDNYVLIHLMDGTVKTISKTLKFIEERLPSDQFVRIHHSYLIHLRYLKKYLKTDGGMVILSHDVQLPISRKYKDRLLTLISK